MIQPIILAAGKGTRMRSERPKTLFEIEGRPMLGHILDAVEKVPACLPPIVVVGHGKDEVISFVGNRGVCVEQTELSGTASAVKVALPHVSHTASGVLVLYGDQPFIKTESIQRLADTFLQRAPVLVQSVVTVPHFENEFEVFAGFGRVVRNKDGVPERIVEYKNATPEERLLQEVNPGTCVVDRAWLDDAIMRIQPNPTTGEYYLTHMLELASQEGAAIVTVDVAVQDALGINSPEDATRAITLLQH